MAAESVPGRYPIRAVARLTGIPVDTLRAWERRHRAVEPRRDERGRMYGDEEVRKLTLLRRLVERGHAIGRIAAMPPAELEGLLGAPLDPAERLPKLDAVDVPGLLGCLDAYDLPGLERRAGRFAAVLSARELVRLVVMPFMREVGEGWLSGRFRTAQEHMATAAMRGLLGSLLRAHAPRDASGGVVLATPPGERHELGILGAAILVASTGLPAVYLGPDLPAGDVAEAARRTGARAVVLGLTCVDDASPVDGALQVAADLPAGVGLVVGGRAALAGRSELQGAGIAVLPDLEALEDAVRDMR